MLSMFLPAVNKARHIFTRIFSFRFREKNGAFTRPANAPFFVYAVFVYLKHRGRRPHSLAVPCFVGNPSDFVPVAGIARALRTASGTSSSGRASIGTVIGSTTFGAVPSELIHRLRMNHIRRGIGIYAFAFRAHHMGIPTGIFKFTPASANDHSFPSVFYASYLK